MMMMFQILEHKFHQQQQHYMPKTLLGPIAAPGLHVVDATPTSYCHYCT
jgi:hypothetical protein